jgi:hypothetical protein
MLGGRVIVRLGMGTLGALGVSFWVDLEDGRGSWSLVVLSL